MGSHRATRLRGINLIRYARWRQMAVPTVLCHDWCDDWPVVHRLRDDLCLVRGNGGYCIAKNGCYVIESGERAWTKSDV